MNISNQTVSIVPLTSIVEWDFLLLWKSIGPETVWLLIFF